MSVNVKAPAAPVTVLTSPASRVPLTLASRKNVTPATPASPASRTPLPFGSSNFTPPSVTSRKLPKLMPVTICPLVKVTGNGSGVVWSESDCCASRTK